MTHLKRLAKRIDPLTGESWLVRVAPPAWAAFGAEGPAKASKPDKAQRAQARRYRRPATEWPAPTTRLAVDDPARQELRREVLAAAGHRCQKCKRRYRLTLDHIVPCAIGGGNHRDNLQCLCKRCNKEKGATIWAPSFRHQIAA